MPSLLSVLLTANAIDAAVLLCDHMQAHNIAVDASSETALLQTLASSRTPAHLNTLERCATLAFTPHTKPTFANQRVFLLIVTHAQTVCWVA
jgi:hypothetical protein